MNAYAATQFKDTPAGKAKDAVVKRKGNVREVEEGGGCTVYMNLDGSESGSSGMISYSQRYVLIIEKTASIIGSYK